MIALLILFADRVPSLDLQVRVLIPAACQADIIYVGKLSSTAAVVRCDHVLSRVGMPIRACSPMRRYMPTDAYGATLSVAAQGQRSPWMNSAAVCSVAFITLLALKLVGVIGW